MICIVHKEEFKNICPHCPPPMPVEIVLEGLYREGQPHKMLYMSLSEEKLNKVRRHFNEQVVLDNLGATITLLFPNSYANLLDKYSHIFIDENVLDADFILEKLNKAENHKIYRVNSNRCVK